MLGKNCTKVFDHIFSHRLTLKFSGDHSLTPCISDSTIIVVVPDTKSNFADRYVVIVIINIYRVSPKKKDESITPLFIGGF
jgi:hypothetical protein